MIELRALNPHWLDSVDEPEYDLCVHSNVLLEIGDKVISNKESGDWTVSASAYLFLKSLNEDHISSQYEQLLPCCGFNFWKIESGFFFGNCGIGINWDIFRRGNKIVNKFKNKEIEVEFGEWRNAIVEFSDEVLNFYDQSVPRKYSDDNSKEEFEYFMSEFRRLRREAI